MCAGLGFRAWFQETDFRVQRRAAWVRFVASHPSDRNKDVAWMGHGMFVAEFKVGNLKFVDEIVELARREF